MTQPTVVRPNTRDMLAVHQVFRDAFGCAPQLVGSVSGERSEQVAVVAAYYSNVLAFLHSHHEGEDELLWPKLRDRAPMQAGLVQSMEQQHEGLSAALTDAETRLQTWLSAPDIDNAAALAAALATLGVLCARHFDEEERRILPLAEEFISVEEWAELPAHGMRSFSGDKLWLIMGLIQEQMPSEARQHMLAGMPQPVREFWLSTGRPQFEEFIASLRR